MASCKRINRQFFKTWSPEMAYVLGFFAADGSMYVNSRGGYYLAFYSNDLEILEKIRTSLSSEHSIGKKQISDRCPHQGYRLQIGDRGMYNDALTLGMVRNKSKILQFPRVPSLFLRDFVRGYFDGDGNILFRNYFRKDRMKYKYYFSIKFISGSKLFLFELQKILTESIKIGKGSLSAKNRGFVLSYAMKDGRKLCEFMYNDVTKDLFLERKYNIYREAINTMGW